MAFTGGLLVWLGPGRLSVLERRLPYSVTVYRHVFCLIHWPLYGHVFYDVVCIVVCTVCKSLLPPALDVHICNCSCHLRIDSRVLRMPDDTLKVYSSVYFLLAPLLTTPANACMCRLYPWMFTYIYCTILHVYPCLPCLQPLC